MVADSPAVYRGVVRDVTLDGKGNPEFLDIMCVAALTRGVTTPCFFVAAGRSGLPCVSCCWHLLPNAGVVCLLPPRSMQV